MATHVWTPTSGNLFTTSGNWTNGVPGAASNIVVKATATEIDCTGMTPAAFGWCKIEKGVYKTFGSSGARFTGSCTYIKHEGNDGSKLWFEDDSSGVTNRIMIAGQAGADLADLTGALPLVVLLRGRATIASSATGLTDVLVGDMGGGDSDARLDVQSSGTVAKLRQMSGTCICNAILTAGEINGGTFIRRGAAACTDLCVSRARAYYEGTGTITRLIAMNGAYVDLDQSFTDSVGGGAGRGSALTVTASYRATGATLRADSGLITHTAATELWGGM